MKKSCILLLKSRCPQASEILRTPRPQLFLFNHHHRRLCPRVLAMPDPPPTPTPLRKFFVSVRVKSRKIVRSVSRHVTISVPRLRSSLNHGLRTSMALPFAPDTFDGATGAFRMESALRHYTPIHLVLRPGARPRPPSPRSTPEPCIGRCRLSQRAASP